LAIHFSDAVNKTGVFRTELTPMRCFESIATNLKFLEFSLQFVVNSKNI